MAKTYALHWAGPALDDLRSIRDYISAAGKPEAAKRLAEKIRRRVLGLQTHALTGRLVPEFPGSGYREVIVGSHRIIYELAKDRVILLRVWHERRDLTRLEH